MTTNATLIHDPLLTVRGLSDLLGKSPSWVYKRLGSTYEPGLLPHPLRIGGEYRWRLSEVERWLDNR